MWLLTELPLQFYTLIPHRLGRSKAEMAAAVIDTIEKLEEKQELLQLMKDVLKVQHQAFAIKGYPRSKHSSSSSSSSDATCAGYGPCAIRPRVWWGVS